MGTIFPLALTLSAPLNSAPVTFLSIYGSRKYMYTVKLHVDNMHTFDPIKCRFMCNQIRLLRLYTYADKFYPSGTVGREIN